MSRLRLPALVLATVLVQVAVFPHWRVLGVVPELGLVLAVAAAFRFGPETGALTGFAAGLLYDLFLATPAGLSALAYALTAYAVGVLQAGMLRSPVWLTPFLGFAGGLAGGLTFLAIGILAGVDGLRTAHALGVVVLAAVYDALVAPFVFLLVGRVLGRDREPATGWVGTGR
jgi:rod shape-determining protein MreD